MKKRLFEDFLDDLEKKDANAASQVVQNSSLEQEEGEYYVSMNLWLNGICSIQDDNDVAAYMSWIKMFREMMIYRLESFKFVKEVCTVKIIAIGHGSNYEWDESGYDEFAENEYQYDDELTIWADNHMMEEEPKRWRMWNMTITFNADIHNLRPIYVLLKNFALPYGYQKAKWINGDNSYMLFGRTGHNGKLFKLPSYTSSELAMDEDTTHDLEEIGSAMLNRKVDYVDIMRDLRYNNIDAILNEYFFPSEYGTFTTLKEFVKDGDVKVVGHFDKIGQTKNPQTTAFERKEPTCAYLMWFTTGGWKSSATTQPWSPTYRMTPKTASVKQFCEETPFTVYLINNEEDDKRMVMMLYDKLFETDSERDGKYFSIALCTERNALYVDWASALSCVTDTYEDAQRVLIDFFGSLSDEDDEDEWDDEDEYDEDFEDYEEDEENA